MALEKTQNYTSQELSAVIRHVVAVGVMWLLRRPKTTHHKSSQQSKGHVVVTVAVAVSVMRPLRRPSTPHHKSSQQSKGHVVAVAVGVI